MPRNKTSLLLNGLCFFVIGMAACHNRAEPPVKEFEGVITYKIDHSFDPDSAQYGDSIRMYYSHGNFLKRYIGSASTGLHAEIYLSEENKYYMQIGSGDSLEFFDLSRPWFKVEETFHPDSAVVVAGHPCTSILYKQTTVSGKKMDATSWYSYAKGVLPVDKRHFQNMKFGSFDVFINEAGCLNLLFVGELKYQGHLIFRRTYRVVDIQEKPIDPTLFVVDPSLVKPLAHT